MGKVNRRSFVKGSLVTAAAAGFPTIVPARVLGQDAPSNHINIGAIGVGRISRGHDMPGVLQYTGVSGPRNNRIIAVCDLDANRVESGKRFVNDAYTKKLGKSYTGTIGYTDYRELLANKQIDAVLISTPDHQHALLAVAATRAGKDVYLQKPASLTISEGRYMVDHVNATGRILQVGSQQRSWKQFYRACELVRNGRIGEIQRVEVGLPGDPAGGNATPMPVPKGFEYDGWLGSTPEVYYTVDRVMPQEGFDRPGWLRMEQFGAGMITGWGAHHIDTAHWGMNTELTGPIEVWGSAEFPTHGLWNVHGAVQDLWTICEWRRNDDLWRVSERNQVVWDEGMDLCTARWDELADGEAGRSGAEGRGAAGERSEDSDQRDRAERGASIYQRRSARELARLHSQPEAADRAAGDWAPRVLDLPVALDCDEDETTPALGPEGGALHQ